MLLAAPAVHRRGQRTTTSGGGAPGGDVRRLHVGATYRFSTFSKCSRWFRCSSLIAFYGSTKSPGRGDSKFLPLTPFTGSVIAACGQGSMSLCFNATGGGKGGCPRYESFVFAHSEIGRHHIARVTAGWGFFGRASCWAFRGQGSRSFPSTPVPWRTTEGAQPRLGLISPGFCSKPPRGQIRHSHLRRPSARKRRSRIRPPHANALFSRSHGIVAPGLICWVLPPPFKEKLVAIPFRFRHLGFLHPGQCSPSNAAGRQGPIPLHV